jgi:hypothetical protein
VEHTQMHLALKKGTKNFHYSSNSCGIFGNFTFALDKFPNANMKVLVYSKFSKKKLEKNEISKLHKEWKISPSQV